MWTFEHTETSSATAEQLWARYSQPATWPEWNTGMTDVALDDLFVPGAKGTLKPADGPRTRFTLTAVEPNRTFTAVSELPMARLTFVHVVEPLGAGIRFTHQATISGPSSLLFTRLVGKNIMATVPGSMRTLARLAEQTPTAVR
ncbi:SRPBCC family protein [Frankia sp. Cppng1_Ct_nod]|uniref:SRPBCC family protein n=1 Tax=Frankia sp. Cppng1_Ct_nod TaxID=2897162 RepID=UPI0013EF9E44|nr:SRPBCC family protein [Frankia sp. Cppng1_Ct_nod]